MKALKQKNILLAGGFAAVAAGFLAAAFLYSIVTPVARAGTPTVFIVPAGEGFREIARELEERGLIRSSAVFKAYAVMMGAAHRLKAGSYLLSPAMSIAEIAYALSAGGTAEIGVVIPEGYTARDIEHTLLRQGVLQESLPPEALAKEGYLFPDTYRFFAGETAEAVAKKMFSTFEAKATPALSTEAVSTYLGKQVSGREIITMASLIEREVPFAEDRRVVSGILWKRLKVGMALQVDATISYAKCEGKVIDCADRQIVRADLEFDSPYNTYLHPGLPPGPISNPGLSAIEAAANPVFTEHWYYLSDPDTHKTIFSRILEEHIENRARYLGL